MFLKLRWKVQVYGKEDLEGQHFFNLFGILPEAFGNYSQRETHIEQRTDRCLCVIGERKGLGKIRSAVVGTLTRFQLDTAKDIIGSSNPSQRQEIICGMNFI
ncbi:MAG: hypothetical protein OSB39_03720 [Opitutales bacterium]|nr:hypothetical protein [Opitutales bacterium]